MSQDQSEVQEQEQQQPVVEEVLVGVQEEAPEGETKKRVRKKARKLTEADMEPPKASIWPLALALAIAFTMAGSIYNAIFFAIGGVLILACIIGWAMERRH